MNLEEVMAQIDNDDDALEVIQKIREKFGFGVVVMTRADVASRWHQDEDEDAEPTITDEEWDAVRGTWAWQKGWSGESIMDDAWWVVDDAISDAKNG